MAALLILITLAIVVAVLTRAFRGANDDTPDAVGQELEEAKLDKYRELRELELDWHTGKLSVSDYEQTRLRLREDAAGLLERSPRGHDAPASANGAAT